MSLWLVRAGRSGEYEDLALKSGRVLVGFDEVPDLSYVKSKEELFEILREAYPDRLKKLSFSTLNVKRPLAHLAWILPRSSHIVSSGLWRDFPKAAWIIAGAKCKENEKTIGWVEGGRSCEDSGDRSSNSS